MHFTPVISRAAIPSPPPASTNPTVMAFGLAKGGSTLLFDILRKLSHHVSLTYFSVEDFLFSSGVGPNQRPGNVGNFFCSEGYCYGGFRQFPAFPVPILHSSKVIVLVRDPRDMLTSLYFSLLHSHKIPDGQAGDAREQMTRAREALSKTTINEHAVQASCSYVRMFEGYIAQGFHWRPNVRVYRYEDVIFAKREWVADICAWYNWDVSPDMIASVADQVDVRVDHERPTEHIRQVVPGNYKAHLKEEALQAVEKRLSEYMRIFGYL